MSEPKVCGIGDLLSIFEEFLEPSDVLAAKLMSQISTAITKERLKLHMSQKDFAEHIHANQSLISRWEHGDYNFSIKKLSDIASSLNLDVNIVFHSISECKISEEFSGSFATTKTIYYSIKGEKDSKPQIYAQNSNSLATIPMVKEDLNKYVTVR